jgi:hypothetical protein
MWGSDALTTPELWSVVFSEVKIMASLVGNQGIFAKIQRTGYAKLSLSFSDWTNAHWVFDEAATAKTILSDLLALTRAQRTIGRKGLLTNIGPSQDMYQPDWVETLEIIWDGQETRNIINQLEVMF